MGDVSSALRRVRPTEADVLGAFLGVEADFFGAFLGGEADFLGAFLGGLYLRGTTAKKGELPVTVHVVGSYFFRSFWLPGPSDGAD